GYESVEALRLLDGVVDIYMPDLKYGASEGASEYSQAPDYPEKAEAALREMHRQVGDLEIGPTGLAVRGLLVRHLVMPEDVAASEKAMQVLADISRDTYVNIMTQYRPCADAVGHPVIGRRLRYREYSRAVKAAREAGLHRLLGAD
ncbi:MAG: radical SAM protein, partial [Armatimonadetes bacterium]|nr:radical SAM protein [Armatimonadota bacterium]